MTTVFNASFPIVDGDAAVGFARILKSQIGGKPVKCNATPKNAYKVLKRQLKMLKLQPNLEVLAQLANSKKISIQIPGT